MRSAGGSLRYPYRYASDQVRFNPMRGDTVWVAACPRWQAQRLPPTLVARLEIIQDCIDLERDSDLEPLDRAFTKFGRYLAKSDEAHAEYFPVNNFYATLMNLEFVGGRRLGSCPKCQQVDLEPGKQLYYHIPYHLQSVRILAENGDSLMRAHAHAVTEQKVFFLSYRHREAELQVREFAAELARQGAVYWLDNEMIRCRARTPQDYIPRERLEQYLSDAIRQSFIFVAFVSPSYLEREWIQYELEQARQFVDQGHVRRVAAIYLAEGDDPIPGTTNEWHLAGLPKGKQNQKLRQIVSVLIQPPFDLDL